jgi:hypothetical protein
MFLKSSAVGNRTNKYTKPPDGGWLVLARAGGLRVTVAANLFALNCFKKQSEQ